MKLTTNQKLFLFASLRFWIELKKMASPNGKMKKIQSPPQENQHSLSKEDTQRGLSKLWQI
jgi:hypothetical protein